MSDLPPHARVNRLLTTDYGKGVHVLYMLNLELLELWKQVDSKQDHSQALNKLNARAISFNP